MARRAGKMRGDLRAMEIQENDPRTNPVRGAGATPSMGLSQFRGGMTYHGGAECDSESDEELVGGNLGMERLVGSGSRRRGGNKEHYKTALDYMTGHREHHGTLPAKSLTVAHLMSSHGLNRKLASKIETMVDDYLHHQTGTRDAAEGLLHLGRGGAHHSHTSHKRQSMNEATQMGLHLGKHLHSLHGAGWWDDFKSGFNSVMSPVAGVAKSVLPILGPEGMAASGLIGALGYGRHRGGAMYPSGAYEGQGRERDDLAMMGMGRRKRAPAGPHDGRRKRAEIVRKVMAERGISMIEASKAVKAEGLY